ncbi:MAG: hypothetical protein MZV70_08790 [Desulfobacterales bacterium]|nr:hypothetical protein [Desulfobacterales bacterium]
MGCAFDGDDRSKSARQPSGSASGTITAAVRFVADSDVNDPAADYIPNDTLRSSPEASQPRGRGRLCQFAADRLCRGALSTNGDPSGFLCGGPLCRAGHHLVYQRRSRR